MHVIVSLKIELDATASLSQGVFHFFARSKEVVNYRKKSGERREHESQEEQTAAE
jgi:hypothetical protein